MKLQAFRIQNYRSIVDTGWKNLSNDNISAFIGQNEAGKTAILEALLSFGSGEITQDVLRADFTTPIVSCSFVLSDEEVALIQEISNLDKRIKDEFRKTPRINLQRAWTNLAAPITLEDEDLENLFNFFVTQDTPEIPVNTTASQEQGDKPEEATTEAPPSPPIEPPVAEKPITADEFIATINPFIPQFRMFRDYSNLLPDKIDVADIKARARVEGRIAVDNFIRFANINLDELENMDDRFVETKTEEISRTVTTNFREFWKQKIGNSNKISIEFAIRRHGETEEEKAGKAYLIFWIKDGSTRLHPKQRSGGVRWFTSFYLELKAIAKTKRNTVLLVDEPGGNLHARAQEDVLKVFEDVKEHVQILYTTHSPFLIDLKTIHRILAVQRRDDRDLSDTVVLTVNELASASTDTLTPIYTLMGADLSDQQAIPQKGNIVLEELSAFYYLLAFWELTETKEEVFFIPVSGVNNIPTYANLLFGWGLGFSMVFDDDKSGRRVYNQIKKDLFFDDEDLAKEKMHKIKKKVGVIEGIEDIFTKKDFKEFILKDTTKDFEDANSVHANNFSKPLLALNFRFAVEKKELSLKDLEKETVENINQLVNAIRELLSKQ